MSGLDLWSMIGFAITGGALFVWEMRGVLNHKRHGDTLSEGVWKLEDIWPGFRWITLGFLCWLIVHFFFNGRFG